IFGGNGITKKGRGVVNELWRYNVNNLHWVWMSGDDRMPSQGEYGTAGVAAATNKPGGRQGAVSWSDPNGNLYMFGGSGRSF
ncbi:hypothetical protein OVV29_38725, partial [Klebsiella pneumoniae]|nr:hypothetical protein [Klebsiella pneumoniae]